MGFTPEDTKLLENYAKEQNISFDDKYINILKKAVENANVEIIKLFLDKPDIITHEMTRSILRYAVKNDHEKVVELLIENCDIEINVMNEVFMEAAKNGNAEIVALFLNHEKKAENKALSIMQLLTSKEKEEAKLILEEKKISIEVKKEALKDAAERGYIKIVKLLVEDPTIGQMDKGLACIKASEKGNLEIVKFLLSLQNLNAFYKGSALCEAAKNGHEAIVKFLLSEQNHNTNENINDVLRSAEEGNKNESIILEKLSKKQNIDKYHLVLAINEAIENRHLEVVKFLLQEENMNSENKNLAIRLAAKLGFEGIVDLLQQEISNIEPETITRTIENAVEKGRFNIVMSLISKYNINSTVRGKLLEIATKNRDYCMVRLLLEERIDMEYICTALQIAKNGGLEEIKSLLLPFVKTMQSTNPASGIMSESETWQDKIEKKKEGVER